MILGLLPFYYHPLEASSVLVSLALNYEKRWTSFSQSESSFRLAKREEGGECQRQLIPLCECRRGEGGGERERCQIGDGRRRSYPVQLGKEEKKKRESFDILVACIVENSYNSRYKW